MMSKPTRGSTSVEIAAPPEAVYDLVSDVTRTGEWSPECRSCTWLGSPGEVGSRFRGRNRRGPLRWSTTAEVTEAIRPTQFAFATIFRGSPATRWSYELERSGTGTRLTESFETVHIPAALAFVEQLLVPKRQEQLEAGLEDSLARIKAVAESTAGS
jgi:uncharacterized protein YndB with AHSA1/START domain